MSEVISKTSQKTRLGELLVRRQVISQQQLEQALSQQLPGIEFLGEALVRLGLAQEKDIVAALVVQCNLPYIAVANYTIEPSVLKLFPAELARKYHAIPLDRVGNVLSVVMADPLNEELKSEIARLTQCQVAAFITTKTELTNAINKWYAS